MAKSEVVQFWSWPDATGGRFQVFAAQTRCVCGGIGMVMPPIFIDDWEVDSHKSPLPCAWADSGGSKASHSRALIASRNVEREDMATPFL
jgi:hypothetical protein